MDVRIVKAGYDPGAVGIDDAGRGEIHLRAATDRDDAVAADEHRVGAGVIPHPSLDDGDALLGRLGRWAVTGEQEDEEGASQHGAPHTPAAGEESRPSLVRPARSPPPPASGPTRASPASSDARGSRTAPRSAAPRRDRAR